MTGRSGAQDADPGSKSVHIEGEPGGRVVFSCLIPLAGRQAVTQRFEAEGDDMVGAAQAALRRVALWRATQPPNEIRCQCGWMTRKKARSDDLFHPSGGKEVIPRDGVNYNGWDGADRVPEQGLRPVGGEQAIASAWLPRPTARSIARKGPLMAKGSPIRLLLIVTGSTLRAEEMDRPLGYYLKQRIEHALSEVTAPAAGPGRLSRSSRGRFSLDPRRAPPEPANNLARRARCDALAHRWLEDIPVSLAYSERYFIQMDPIWPSPASASGAWIIPPLRSPFPYSSIDFCRGSWNVAPHQRAPHHTRWRQRN